MHWLYLALAIMLSLWAWAQTPIFCWFGFHRWEPNIGPHNAILVLLKGARPCRCKRCGCIR
jgi:hypothetical protein